MQILMGLGGVGPVVEVSAIDSAEVLGPRIQYAEQATCCLQAMSSCGRAQAGATHR